MQRNDWQVRVGDILQAISRIEEYVAGMDAQAFFADHRTIDAVVRNLIIIGEAAGHVAEDFRQANPAVPWTLMRGMRHVVVHEYWGVDLNVIWRTATEDLSTLKTQLEALPNR